MCYEYSIKQTSLWYPKWNTSTQIISSFLFAFDRSIITPHNFVIINKNFNYHFLWKCSKIRENNSNDELIEFSIPCIKDLCQLHIVTSCHPNTGIHFYACYLYLIRLYVYLFKKKLSQKFMIEMKIKYLIKINLPRLVFRNLRHYFL